MDILWRFFSTAYKIDKQSNKKYYLYNNLKELVISFKIEYRLSIFNQK